LFVSHIPSSGQRLNGRGVADALKATCWIRGYPTTLRIDQRPEFTGTALDQWATTNGVKLLLIQPGKPTQNVYIESFNGRFRDECLNEPWLTTLDYAKAVIASWRKGYNEQRPHSAIGNRTLAGYTSLLRESGALSPIQPASDKLAEQGSD
jgi:putative transposase